MRVSKQLIIWIFLFFILLRPAGLVHVLGISGITRLAQYFVMLYFLLYYLMNFGKHKVYSTANKILIAYCLWIFILTVRNGDTADIYECFNVVFVYMCLCYFVCYILRRDINKALKTMVVVYGFLLTANALLMILFPHGIYNQEMYEIYDRGNWLFGHVNNTLSYSLPAMLVAFLYFKFSKEKNKLFVTVYLLLISFVNVILGYSVTSLVATIAFFASLFFIHTGKYLKIFRLKTALIISSILFVGIIFFNIQYNYTYLFETILHRSTDFTSRTLIWSNSISLLNENQNFLFGLGYHVSATWTKLIHGAHAHDEYLFSLLQGGIPALVMLYSIFISLSHEVDKKINCFSAQVIISSCFAILIQFIAESSMYRIAPLLALIMNARYFINIEEKNQMLTQSKTDK